MKCIALICLFVAFQVATYEAESAALDHVKDAAKKIVDSAADKADAVTEIPQEGGVMQTMLHKTASVAMDKGMDLLAKKYPIVNVAAPHIKKFSKPLMNAAHSKINNMLKGTTTVAPVEGDGQAKAEGGSAEAATTVAPAAGGETEKPSMMDKLKSFVGKKDEPTTVQPEEAVKTEEKVAEKEEEKPNSEGKKNKRKRKSGNGKGKNKKPKVDNKEEAKEVAVEEAKPEEANEEAKGAKKEEKKAE